MQICQNKKNRHQDDAGIYLNNFEFRVTSLLHNPHIHRHENE
jgi:hypothetical protein